VIVFSKFFWGEAGAFRREASPPQVDETLRELEGEREESAVQKITECLQQQAKKRRKAYTTPYMEICCKHLEPHQTTRGIMLHCCKHSALEL